MSLSLLLPLMPPTIPLSSESLSVPPKAATDNDEVDNNDNDDNKDHDHDDSC